MTDLNAERERIGRALENGYMTATDHRRIKRAIDREQRRRDKIAAEDQARLAARKSLRRDLQQSLNGDAR